jgi:hypothetical protein
VLTHLFADAALDPNRPHRRQADLGPRISGLPIHDLTVRAIGG